VYNPGTARQVHVASRMRVRRTSGQGEPPLRQGRTISLKVSDCLHDSWATIRNWDVIIRPSLPEATNVPDPRDRFEVEGRRETDPNDHRSAIRITEQRDLPPPRNRSTEPRDAEQEVTRPCAALKPGPRNPVISRCRSYPREAPPIHSGSRSEQPVPLVDPHPSRGSLVRDELLVLYRPE